MRPRFLICILILASVILTLVFWLRPVKQITTSYPTHEPIQQNDNNQLVRSTTQSSVDTPQTNSTAIETAQVKSANELTVEDKNAQIRAVLEAQNKPIEVWGKVVDQDDASLSGVKVQAAFGHFVWPPEQYPNGVSSSLELFTDANGQFHIQDNSATSVGVVLQKDGYEQESLKGNGYALGDGGGSQANPIILKMWSTNSHQKLITGEKSFQIVPDGRLYFLKIIDNAISESGDGDLKIWIKRPAPIISRRYEWSCEVEAVNCGIMREENNDIPMYQAPADGYKTSFSYSESADANGWGNTTGEQRFYIKLNNGRNYGRISIELEAYHNNHIPGLIRLSYAINPSGSRILR